MSDAAALIPAQGTDFAAALNASPLPNLRRIGGEMFAWTDHDPRRAPAVPRGAVLRHLAATYAAPGRTVLVAGPAAEDLVGVLAGAGAAVTWLVRSLGDAENAARTHPDVTVLAGSVVKLDPADLFDVVVAFDGVERLNSAEGEQMSASELVDRLAGAVRPDGVLLLMHDNHLGLHHTVQLGAGAREADDAAWYPLDENDNQRPASREQLADRLAAAGLVVDVAYAAFPDPAAPTVLIGPGLVGNVASPLRPRLGTALSQAFTAGYRGRPVLSDPRRLAKRALRAGAEDTVAPSWLVVARASGSAATPVADRHDLLIGDTNGTFAYEVTAAPGGEIRTTVLQPLEAPVERAGLRRIAEPSAPGADSGYVLEDRLLHLCAIADLRQLRLELGQYESWLRARATDGTLTGPVAVAGFPDVFVTQDGPALLPTRWEPIEPVAYDTALVRVVWEFAVQLITSAQPHPWAITSSAVDLAVTLLGMMGRGATEEQVRAAVDLQIALETAEFDLSLDDQHDRKLRLLAVNPGTAPVDIAGYRELEEALWRQRYQASHLLGMMEWTEGIIGSRDNQLSKLDREVTFYRSKWPNKGLFLLRALIRKARRRS
jgi:hypothetical protein